MGEKAGTSLSLPKAGHALPWLTLIIAGEQKQRVRVVVGNASSKRELLLDVSSKSKIEDLLSLASRTLGVDSKGYDLVFMKRTLKIGTTLSWNHIFPGATLNLMKSKETTQLPSSAPLMSSTSSNERQLCFCNS
mmetsp:Transcript_15006/g.28555  ORF Transcript_15006/g.28555 Transcript_15006/m.28555 type:complete len:134 (-) Transcript_15006:351-752(-)